MSGTDNGRAFGPSLSRANDSELLDAALVYAGELGWPVFPCDGKVPLTAQGLYDATTDEDQIRLWWKKHPRANIALPTGRTSGVVVIDADGSEGVANARGLLGEGSLTALQSATGGGGRHYFYESPDGDCRVTNSNNKLAPSVDTRGDGGYVMLPPSATEGPYRWTNVDGEVNEWKWGTTDVSSEAESVDVSELPVVEVEDSTAVAKRDRLLEEVLQAHEGERNSTLFQASADLGVLAKAGALDATRTVAALSEVATTTGLHDREITGTVRSGISNGASQVPTPIDPKTIDIARLLDDVASFLRRFVVFAHDEQVDALALWVAHTHAVETADCTPYIWVSSPAPTSGKTRLAEVVELLVRSPLRTSNASAAAVFRSIPKWRPTLILDEMDTRFNADNNDEDLRGIINAGFNQGSFVMRTVGTDLTPTKFDVFCPKMLVGINTGSFPDTVAKRSIPVRMHRKTRTEPTERFRRRKVGPGANQIHDSLVAWSGANVGALTEAEPSLPDELNDRQQDAWEPLLAIADMAGAPWNSRARTAAKFLHDAAGDETTQGVLLLGHIQEIFAELKSDRVFTKVLLQGLVDKEEGPWAEWWEQKLSYDNVRGPSAQLSRMLSVFGIHPDTIRIGAGQAKGYLREQFEPHWTRYFEGTE